MAFSVQPNDPTLNVSNLLNDIHQKSVVIDGAISARFRSECLKILDSFIRPRFVVELQKASKLFSAVYDDVDYFHVNDSLWQDSKTSDSDFLLKIAMNLPVEDEDVIFDLLVRPGHARIQLTKSIESIIGQSDNLGLTGDEVLSLFHQADLHVIHPAAFVHWFYKLIQKGLNNYLRAGTSSDTAIDMITPDIVNDELVLQIALKISTVITLRIIPAIKLGIREDTNVLHCIPARQRVDSKAKNSFWCGEKHKKEIGYEDLWIVTYPNKERIAFETEGCAEKVYNLLRILRDHRKWSSINNHHLATIIVNMKRHNKWPDYELGHHFINALYELKKCTTHRSLQPYYDVKRNLFEDFRDFDKMNITIRKIIKHLTKKPFKNRKKIYGHFV